MGTFKSPAGFAEVTNPRELAEHMSEPSFRLIYRAKGGSIEAHFDTVCKVVKAVRGVSFFIDELDRFVKAGWMPFPFKELVDYGRHYRVSLFCTARNVAQVPRAFTGACTEIICFHQSEPVHLGAWEERAGADFAAKLPQLKQFEQVTWTPNAFAGRMN